MEKSLIVHEGRAFNDYISVDCVIFGFDFTQLNVLLVERVLYDDETGEIVFKDFTLAGHHIYQDEDLDEAAARILYDLTGLTNIYLEQFKVFGSPNRITREHDRAWLRFYGRNPDDRIITVGYYSLVGLDRITIQSKGWNVAWVPVSEINDLAFDHMDILSEALKSLRIRLLYEPVGFELLPPRFTLSQLQRLYEIILGVEMDKRNFRKKVARMKYLIPLEEKQQGVPHKPARLYLFDRAVYEKTRDDMMNFSI